jgi:hypothetical protein
VYWVPAVKDAYSDGHVMLAIEIVPLYVNLNALIAFVGSKARLGVELALDWPLNPGLSNC